MATGVLRATIAEAHAAKGQNREALDLLLAAIKDGWEIATPLVARAKLLRKLGEHGKAFADMMKADEINPTLVAIETDRWLAANSRDIGGHLFHGLHKERSFPADAIADYRAAIAAKPRDGFDQLAQNKARERMRSLGQKL